MTTHPLEEFRVAKDEFFKTDQQSPIVDQAAFQGLDYYAVDKKFSFTVVPVPVEETELSVQTSDGQTRTYMRSATVGLDGPTGRIELALYSTDAHSGFFLPFRDSTSGKATYGAGRYLDLEAEMDGTVAIDFNRAYNPYCAYSEAYSCPLPPVENWLTVPIEAGERSFSAD